MTRRKQTKTGTRRTRIISLRVNEEEARELAGLAEQRGVTLSRFLIEAAKQAGDIDKARQDAEQGPVVRELQRIRTEIWRIGHNVNQVAHNTNRDLAVSAEQEASVVAAVRECGRLVEKVSGIFQRRAVNEGLKP
ncbi:plasmid mobilization protein [Bifidobacterium boum]|uniref:plasmid mobilization protein n=1 Tax=Bifidobacterium boum TaxID=78343 RepID=UPI003F8FFC3A